MNDPNAAPSLPHPRRSVFWKVASILVGVQVATGVLAVALSAWFAYDRSLDLVRGSLRLRLDGLAEEIEQRAAPFSEGLDALPLPLQLDLASRFPDPITLLDADGTPIRTIMPDADAFPGPAVPPPTERSPPSQRDTLLANGDITIQLDEDAPAGTWGLAPLYDADGLLVGGLLVQPLTRSIDRELEGPREAYTQALVVVGVLAGLTALLLGAFFTWRLVRPLRRMTRQVERIGAGEYAARLSVASDDEFGRLATAINQMAAAVEQSIETLRATDQLRRELIANVGHDLRTPLAAVLGYLEEAQRHLGQRRLDAARETLATAERQGRYLNQLVDDLFELSLLDSAEPPLRHEPIPLSELLTDAARTHRPAFEDDNISFKVAIPSSLPTIEGDGVRLLRALDNLLTNARRHTPSGGCVRFAAKADDEVIRIHVDDTGAGITLDERDRVFDRYYRGEEARGRKDRGTGLGLPISRAIAHAHGGDLTVESTPGEGSTFTLQLPNKKPG